MSEVWVVRHGQASLRAADYDQLSPLGEEQARLMGAHYLMQGKRWDRVIVGPRKRHMQTFNGIQAAYQEAGVDLPEPELWACFDEHRGASVVKKAICQERGIQVGGILPNFIKTAEDERHYFERFQDISRRWASGTHVDDEFERFSDFSERVSQGLIQIVDEAMPQNHILVVCSGGPVANTAGYVLGVSDVEKMALSWIVYNGAHAAFRFGNNRPLSLLQFNGTPGFPEPRLWTMI